MTAKDVNINHLRHSCAHLLAKAVLELWPGSHNAIGPSIENGFYQDFDMGSIKISEADLPKIEAKMKELLPTWEKFTFKEVSLEEAKKLFKANPYKLEMAQEFAKQGKKLQTNDPGNFLDLCKMGHVDNPAQELKHFKLLSVAGAYWRGSEKNKMLTRIYGTAWPTQKELDDYLWQLAEAKKRDHRKLGRELDLFHFQAEAPGMPFWHPKGVIIRNLLLDYSRKLQKKYGYLEIQTPFMMRVSIFKQSGHWNHYHDDMFFSSYEDKKDIVALKPMNCPGMIQVYKERPRSYRDLPLYYSEYGVITRKEQPGELNGLFRVMQAWQDDAHIFTPREKIGDVIEQTIHLVDEILKPFNLKYQAFLSTRPEKFMGEKATWDTAETALKQAMRESGLEINLKEKDGAFYGPKIDYQLLDSLGRDWQTATIQLDFQMPETFKLEYTGQDGQPQRPVIIHRTIMGSLERFIGILLEHFAGAFPTWLSPIQVLVLPIGQNHHAYAKKVVQTLEAAHIRTQLDAENKSLPKRIKLATEEKIPYLLVVGDREVKANTVSIRIRGQKDQKTLSLENAVSAIKDNSRSKAVSPQL